MIRSIRDSETKKVWDGFYSSRLPNEIQRVGLRKLIHIQGAINLNDLRTPPGNRLHKLKGDRKGQHSISINDQWRICFNWRNGHAYDVEITDYHE